MTSLGHGDVTVLNYYYYSNEVIIMSLYYTYCYSNEVIVTSLHAQSYYCYSNEVLMTSLH